ncbi:MAG: hypothetical protein MPL62_16425, partial [Alphaproteobacteria bacterium]|nr:hypothetical protein [Alphaproteobacteria bacterium]
MKNTKEHKEPPTTLKSSSRTMAMTRVERKGCKMNHSIHAPAEDDSPHFSLPHSKVEVRVTPWVQVPHSTP